VVVLEYFCYYNTNRTELIQTIVTKSDRVIVC